MAVNASTRIVGLFGHPIRHSASPAMHNAAFRHLNLNYIYLPFDVHPNNLEAAVCGIRALGIDGVNITIPHKSNIIGYLDSISYDAKAIESVNTIHNEDGKLTGHTTDGIGFMQALCEAWKNPCGCNAAVIGAGGSARATIHALLKSGATVSIVNRTPERAMKLTQLMRTINGKWPVEAVAGDAQQITNTIRKADLLVNCTPVGMYPNIDASPVPQEALHSGLFVYDQIYNPAETKLIKMAKEIGAKTSNGLMMLVYQGAASFEIWTGREAPVDVMKAAISYFSLHH